MKLTSKVRKRYPKWKRVYFIIQAEPEIGLLRSGYVFLKRQAEMIVKEIRTLNCDAKIISYTREEIESLKREK